MKSCVFHSLRIVSTLESAARKIEFNQKATVLKGPNQTGKSSIIKSLYWTLGADPGRESDRWKKARVTTLLEMSIDGQPMRVLRDGNLFAAFDSQGKLLVRCNRVSAWAKFLVERLRVGLRLTDKEGNSSVPTPAFLFLPFYIDQDTGWERNWHSFARLGQFSSWRQDVVDYYAGIRPDAFYIAKSRVQELQNSLLAPKARLNVLTSIQHDFADRLNTGGVTLDRKQYQREIEELLMRANHLRELEDSYKHELSELEEKRRVLVSQIQILKRVEKELNADFSFSTELPDDRVRCPTCGEEYDNKFAERFAIAADEDRCLELSNELSSELEAVENKLQGKRRSLEEAASKFNEVRTLLERKEGDVTLAQIIQGEGRLQVKIVLTKEVESLQELIGNIDVELDSAKSDMSRLSSRERRQQIIASYQLLFRRFLLELNVLTLPEPTLADPQKQVTTIGSEMPRALLAYFFSFLHLIRENKTGAESPVVIDTLNQQEQDPKNIAAMLGFVATNLPKDGQLILGVVDDRGVDFGGSVVHLATKYSALAKEQYDAVAAEVRPFLVKATAAT